MPPDSVFRLANDTIADRARKLEITGPVPFICECDDDRCFALVHVALAEYEDRAHLGPITHPRHLRVLVAA
jgi:hypothetical protein